MALNTKPSYFGFNPPFIGGPSGILSRQEDEKLLKNDLLQLLLTLPGERVMLPEFGTDLRAIIFDQLDDAMLEMLKVNISTAIMQFEPRVKIQALYLQPDYDRHGLNIRIVFSLLTQPASVVNLDTFISGNQNG